jgi:hypothetical protein
MEHFLKTRVMSRDIINDLKASIQNIFGMRLSPYEIMIQRGKKDVWNELDKEGIKPTWYRYDITFMESGSIAIILYGDAE